MFSTRRLVIGIGIAAVLSCGGVRPGVAAMLTVVSPNGGEHWAAGSTHNITWTSSGLVGDVYIDLYKGGVHQQFLGYTSALTGSWPWTICAYIGDAADYSIQLTGFDSLAQPVVDASNGPFQISGSLPLAAPSVTVTSPNGGESWLAGTQHLVTWTAVNPSGFVTIELFKGGQYLMMLGLADMSDGQFLWDVCTYIGDGTDYRVRIGGLDVCGRGVADFSNANFSISGSQPAPPTPTITLTAPNAGETWTAGTTQTITWSATDPLGEVWIDLYKGGVYDSTLGMAPMAAEQFDWEICKFQANGSDYSIMIVGQDACGRMVYALSNLDFSIAGGLPLPTVTVTSPNGGQTWLAGSTRAVTWNSTNPVGDVEILLFKGNAYAALLGTAPMAAGTINWTICPTIGNGSDYSIRVWQLTCGPVVEDYSDGTFTIAGSSAQPVVTITSPVGNDDWAAGTTHTITWTATNPSGNVQLYLAGLSDVALVSFEFIGLAPMANEGFEWTIGHCEGRGETMTYQIVMYYGCPEGLSTATSNEFLISPTPAVVADFNGDCYVDQIDYELFTACSTGPMVPYDPDHLPDGCMLPVNNLGGIDADFDGDGDVDQSDFGRFQRCYSGPDVFADPGC